MLVALAGRGFGGDAVKLLPGDFTLNGSEARQTLMLEAYAGTNAAGQISDGTAFTSADPAIVKIEGNVAVPVANGKTRITATAGERSAAVEVTVAGLDKPFEWSFRNHVESVLSKAGCNSGACHGALAGKKGFKLSLGAFDPNSDFFYITRQARARRVVRSDPGHSLVLMKPTGAVP
ncbi:MAG TPA: Ig-like domain-containing protein, partial [Pirellulales bacterium]|nr:Ig-like domain-containing protein [Pirellulales bacterium]